MYRYCPEHPEIREILTYGEPFETKIPNKKQDCCNEEFENLQNLCEEECKSILLDNLKIHIF